MERSRARAVYFARINRVIDYVTSHLGDKLPLELLAREAMFSPWHFHRIFQGMTGESVGAFVRRLRLERAANRLLGNPDDPVTAIALDCGYSSSATFAREFKEWAGMSATDYRKSKNGKADGKNRKAVRNTGKASSAAARYDGVTRAAGRPDPDGGGTMMALHVEVKQLPARRVIYARHIGKYDDRTIGKTWEQLCTWAGARGLMKDNPQCLGISYDNPEITPPEKCRYDACIAVGPEVKGSGVIGTADLAGGLYACAAFSGYANQLAAAYGDLCGRWLPESGYQPADGPALEVYHQSEQTKSGTKLTGEVCIPVKPL